MGLDLYLRKILKPELSKEVYTSKELADKGIYYIDVNTPNICNTIKNNSAVIDVIDRIYVKEELAKEAGIDPSKVAYLSRGMESFGKSHIVMFYLLDENEEIIGEVTINASDDRFLKDYQHKVYAYDEYEVAYQRKGINDFGLLPANCQPCDDYKVVERLVVDDHLSIRFLENWESGKTVFTAWW